MIDSCHMTFALRALCSKGHVITKNLLFKIIFAKTIIVIFKYNKVFVIT